MHSIIRDDCCRLKCGSVLLEMTLFEPLYQAMVRSGPINVCSRILCSGKINLAATYHMQLSLSFLGLCWQGYASQYFGEVSTLLGRLPRVVLLLLKTNDCLRAVDNALVNLFFGFATCIMCLMSASQHHA